MACTAHCSRCQLIHWLRGWGTHGKPIHCAARMALVWLSEQWGARRPPVRVCEQWPNECLVAHPAPPFLPPSRRSRIGGESAKRRGDRPSLIPLAGKFLGLYGAFAGVPFALSRALVRQPEQWGDRRPPVREREQWPDECQVEHPAPPL